MYLIPKMMKMKRNELKQTQATFAEYIAVNANTIIAWETNRYVPASEMYPMIAKLLDVPFEQIEKMCESEKENRKKNGVPARIYQPQRRRDNYA